MTIHLVSTDPELYKLCRDILTEIPELWGTWKLVAVSAGEAWQGADLRIWDFDPGLRFTADPRENSTRQLFLVGREDLGSFYELTGAADTGNVLLKPVTRATLTTFLTPAVSRGAVRSFRADRDEVLQCLIQTNLKLQEYDQDRTTFLARAIHDFRAPLTALSGYCTLLLSEPLGSLNEIQKEVLRRMHTSAKRLSRMANAMFELSVGRQIKRKPDVQQNDIRECLEQALHEIAPFSEDKSISITAELESAGTDLYFESGQIVQVLMNILDNACKFTPKGGAIEIRGYPFFCERRDRLSGMPFPTERRMGINHEPNSYRVDIADSGAPIPVQHLRSIFEEYTSYAGARDRSGGGLGLAICKMIITQHGGRIWVDNKDSGPVFSFVLPLNREEDQVPAAGPSAIQNTTLGVITDARR